MNMEISMLYGAEVLLYHLENPVSFLRYIASRVNPKVFLLSTRVACYEINQDGGIFNLSEIAVHEGVPGRWYQEFSSQDLHSEIRESESMASYHNLSSFWIMEEYLDLTIRKAGFDIVAEIFPTDDNVEFFFRDVDYNNRKNGTRRATMVCYKMNPDYHSS